MKNLFFVFCISIALTACGFSNCNNEQEVQELIDSNETSEVADSLFNNLSLEIESDTTIKEQDSTKK